MFFSDSRSSTLYLSSQPNGVKPASVVRRVVSLSLCSGGECFISGSLDRTVLLWDQRVEKCQVDYHFLPVGAYAGLMSVTA